MSPTDHGSPHRPGIARADGLRARNDGLLNVPQTTEEAYAMFRKMTIFNLLSLCPVLIAIEARADVNVLLRLVDQNNVEIPGSSIQVPGVGVTAATGDTVTLPAFVLGLIDAHI